MQHAEPLGDAEDDVHIMFGKDQGQALFLGDLFEQSNGLTAFKPRHPRGGFIQHEESGAGGQGYGDLQPLLITMGKHRGGDPTFFLESHLLQDAQRFRGDALKFPGPRPETG